MCGYCCGGNTGITCEFDPNQCGGRQRIPSGGGFQRGGRIRRQQGGPGSNLPNPWGNED